MEISHLREFVYLAETLSFKGTADYFFVSRSVISRHVSALETELNAKLLDRSSHVVKLTEVGEIFYSDAITLLRDYDTTISHVKLALESSSTLIRIGYLRNINRAILVQFVRKMKQAHPELQLTLSCLEYSELRTSLAEGAIDIALGVNVDPAVSRNYRSTFIYSDQFYAIMGKDNPLARKTGGITITEIPPEKLLLPDSFVHSGHAEMADEFIGATSQTTASAHEHYFDADEMFLKLQIEDYVVFSPFSSSALLGENLVCLPVTDINSTFTVSAFYREGFCGDAFLSCREVLEEVGSLYRKDD